MNNPIPPKPTTAILLAFVCLLSACASNHSSEYVGEEHRAIKSLSADDIRELSEGGGWGLAKAAELNGVPGPAHILEMASEIKLTPTQQVEIEKTYQQMSSEAISLGNQLIQLEATLNTHFADGSINQTLLEQSVQDIERVRAQLRIVHLSAHLQTPNILTKEQISLYNELRGYSQDPCANVPKGHNAAMWKKHNGCTALDQQNTANGNH